MSNKHNIVIVGGGLSGLTLAYNLQQKGMVVTILEASSRLGGRIQTVNGKLGTPMELGATWCSDMHPNLLALIDELGLTIYAQYSEGISLFQTKSFEPPQQFYVPGAETPSYRLTGGTQTLINRLLQKIDRNNIYLDAKVMAVKELGTNLAVETAGGKVFNADKVVICVPPHLATCINFTPALPATLTDILPTVQTWMAGAVKFVIEYNEPFWRNKGYSGMLYSHAGIVTEMYDHTNADSNKFGFTGFLNSGAASFSPEVRKELVLSQLSGLLGEKIMQPACYLDKVWNNEFITAGAQTIYRPHQNNGHPLLQQSYLGGRLYFGATETAASFPGYMEGAVVSAKHLLVKLDEQIG